MSEDVRPTRRKVLRIGVAAALVGGGVFAGSRALGTDPNTPPTSVVGRPAPHLEGRGLDGEPVSLEQSHGRMVLVNVWASWCAPCRDEYPVLRDTANALTEYGLDVIGINTQDEDEKARAFLGELGGSAYPSVVDPDGRIAVDWATFGVPETFLVDREGIVVLREVGEVDESWVSDNVIPHLDG